MKHMRISYLIIAVALCFCAPFFAEGKADDLLQQAESSLSQKDFTKARYFYIQAYRAFTTEGNYAQAINCGTKAATLYYRENYYQEAFELCRNMTQFLIEEEQKAEKVFYDQRFQLTNERLQMYIKLRNTAQAQLQLSTLNNIADQSGSEKLAEELLYNEAIYYYTFGQNDRGDESFNKLASRFKNRKDYDKVSECYKQLIAAARTANNASLMERTYEKYIVWTDSVKALNAQDELGALQLKYDESKKTIEEKDDQLSGKQYLIAGLCTLAVILTAALVALAFMLLRFIVVNKKLKNIIQTTNEHGEQQSRFIQSISEQMKPTLDALDSSTGELSTAVPQKESIQKHIDALRLFSENIQELSALENSLMETYETQTFNVGTFCKKTMEKISDKVHPDVELVVDAPPLEVKSNPEQLERILLHLLNNAALYTTSGKIWLEFKRKGAHLCHLIVTDNGTGISDERKENLFKPFNEVKDLAEGDGLGLPICALIAGKLNGSLSIDKDYRKGSRFVLVLKV